MHTVNGDTGSYFFIFQTDFAVAIPVDVTVPISGSHRCCNSLDQIDVTVTLLDHTDVTATLHGADICYSNSTLHGTETDTCYSHSP